MRIRLGSRTGSPTSGGEDAKGCYVSLGESRDELVGLKSIYYGHRKIWPGEGLMRITSLKLSLSTELSNLLLKYQMSTNDFTSEGGSLSVSIGTRTFTRSPYKADILWDAATSSLNFLNNNGPWADSILRGDYVSLSVRLAPWADEIRLSEPSTSALIVRHFHPVTTCDIYIGAQWHDYIQGAAIVCNDKAEVMGSVTGQTSKESKKSATERYGEERTLRGVGYAGYISLAGSEQSAMARISYQEASQHMSCKVLDIEIKE